MRQDALRRGIHPSGANRNVDAHLDAQTSNIAWTTEDGRGLYTFFRTLGLI